MTPTFEQIEAEMETLSHIMLTNEAKRQFAVVLAKVRLEERAALEPRLLQFGTGKLVVDTGTIGGEPAVFIAPATIGGVVGTSAKRENHPTDQLLPGEVVLQFPTDEQARFVADAIVGTALKQDNADE